MTRVHRLFFVAVMLVLILASAGCAELPAGTSGWSGDPSSSDQEEGPDVGSGYLTPATPYPTITTDMVRPTLNRPPEPVPTEDPYVTLYNRTTAFNLTHPSEAYSFDLTAPPLIIDYTVEPKMVTRDKHGASGYGSKKDGVFKQTYPSETSQFTVTVRDHESGEIVAEDGFGGLLGTETKKRIFIGKFGNYLIQFSGNDVTVQIMVRAGGV